ncbi:hypothetical protein FRB94_008553 [Tulasnella sp. JGI-2019a]|nr:hypothetical protein FRB94_008553 [Tulasnella sp. JGI-2019a]KAG9010624.1 hypothetical protein FRB93_003892 [Tulasnella sp. JGI-2019a]
MLQEHSLDSGALMSQRVSTDEPTLVVSLPQGVEASRWEIEKNQKDVLIIGGDTAANIITSSPPT